MFKLHWNEHVRQPTQRTVTSTPSAVGWLLTNELHTIDQHQRWAEIHRILNEAMQLFVLRSSSGTPEPQTKLLTPKFKS